MAYDGDRNPTPEAALPRDRPGHPDEGPLSTGSARARGAGFAVSNWIWLAVVLVLVAIVVWGWGWNFSGL